MKKLFIKLFIFLGINFIIMLVFIFLIETTIQGHWTTTTEYFAIPNNSYSDILFMGASHAWVFNHYENKTEVERILKKKIDNIAQLNAGPVVEKVYLDLFLSRDNKTKKIVYFVDPFVFYSSKYNEHNLQVLYTNIDPFFYFYLLKEGVNTDVISYNIIKFFSLKWFYRKPTQDNIQLLKVKDLSLKKINERLTDLYSEKTNIEKFNMYRQKFEEIIDIDKRNNIQITLVIPPTLLHDQNIFKFKKYLDSLEKIKKISYYDFSNAVPDSKYYFDTDHLNSEGVKFFTKNFLAPILK